MDFNEPSNGSIYPKNFDECLLWPIVIACLGVVFVVLWAMNKFGDKLGVQGECGDSVQLESSLV